MLGLVLAVLLAQEPVRLTLDPAEASAQTEPDLLRGTGILISLINRLSTKNVQEGAGVYARTVLPVSNGTGIVIPVGTMVYGRVVASERAGRVKGKAAMVLAFQSITFEDGRKIPIYASLGNSDTGVRKGEATIEAEPGKDAEDVAVAGARGAAGGAVVGALSRGVSIGKGAGLGAAAGLAGGLAEALIRRGDDLTLERGSVIEIVLDQDLTF